MARCPSTGPSPFPQVRGVLDIPSKTCHAYEVGNDSHLARTVPELDPSEGLSLRLNHECKDRVGCPVLFSCPSTTTESNQHTDRR